MSAARCVVLVVDDESLIRGLIEDALIVLGYDVIAADTGDAALLILGSEAPIDVIVSDIIMPGETNGFDLIKQAKALRPGIQTIAMSGYVAKHGDKIALADRFLHKPFTMPVLERTLQYLLLEKCA